MWLVKSCMCSSVLPVRVDVVNTAWLPSRLNASSAPSMLMWGSDFANEVIW